MMPHDKEYTSPDEPLAEMGYESENIKTFPAATGIYTYGVQSGNGEICLFMVQSDNGWLISERLQKQKLSLPYPMNEMMGGFYQAKNEKQSLVQIYLQKKYKSTSEYPTELTDKAGSKYELYYVSESWIPGLEYVVFCRYLGLGNVDAKDFGFVEN